MKRKNRQDEHRCVFTFKTTADLVAKCGKQRLMLMCEGHEQRWRWVSGDCTWMTGKQSQLLFSFLLKDAIEGFFVFDKVANSTKKNNRMDFLMKSGTGLPQWPSKAGSLCLCPLSSSNGCIVMCWCENLVTQTSHFASAAITAQPNKRGSPVPKLQTPLAICQKKRQPK